MNHMFADDNEAYQLKPLKDMPKLISHSATITDEHLKLDNLLLFARPVTTASLMTYSFTDTRGSEKKDNIDRPALLLSTGHIDVVLKGCWDVEIFTLSKVTTLFAFLNYQAKNGDRAKKKSEEGYNAGSFSVLVNSGNNFITTVSSKNKTFMSLLVSNMLHTGDNCMDELFSFVRNMENYWIAYFLLSQLMCENTDTDGYKLYNAYKVYGVSESYFRKLCQNAFTCGPKKQLRMWRAAHSALQLIEKDNSIATVAGNNGYSSSSHFASEIKSIFGITPREFKKMSGFLHE